MDIADSPSSITVKSAPRVALLHASDVHERHTFRPLAVRPAASRPRLFGGARPCACASGAAASSGCGSRISTRAAAARSSSTGIFEDLSWLGLDWDGDALVQSQRTQLYAEALDRLRELGLVYACFCTRADIAAVADRAARRCRQHLSRHLPRPARRSRAARERRRIAGGWIRPRRWRSPACRAGRKRTARRSPARPGDIGDAILARKDAPSSYHLACVVDDAASGRDLVVRGADLRPRRRSSGCCRPCSACPNRPISTIRLVAHDDGRRLAKRDLAPTLAAMRDAGVDGPALARDLLAGQLPLGFSLSEG